MRFDRAAASRAYRSVVDQVCDAVMSADLHIGDMLPPEREIAAQTGISRTSVREALKVLTDASLVAVKPGGGGGTFVVSDVIPSELLGKAIELSHKRLLRSFRGPQFSGADRCRIGHGAERRQANSQAWKRPSASWKISSRTRPRIGALRTIDLRFHLLMMKASGNDAMVEH